MSQTTEQRRVLIITYYWPPSGGSGVQRWLKFAKYLPGLGWRPVVVVPKDADYAVRDEQLESEIPDSVDVIKLPIREPYSLYRKLTNASAKPGAIVSATGSNPPGILQRIGTWIRANVFVPDPKILWVKATVASLTAYLEEHPVEAIVTTGPPHSVHLIGRQLKRDNPSLTWLMDVRDPWSRFDVHLAFHPGQRARRRSEALERGCLSEADAVVGTAPSMPDNLEPFDHSKFVCITNGYDAHDFAALDSTEDQPSSGWNLYHTGLLTASRNPVAVWEALARICTRDASFAERLHIHLIGTVDAEVVDCLSAHPILTGCYTITGWMPHHDLVKQYSSANCLLLCPNQSDNARSQINGKLFEYLAAKRPVLHIGPFDADNTRILDEAHAGLTVLPGDVDAAESALLQIIEREFASNAHAFNEAVIARYERQATTRRLVDLLELTASR